MHPTKKRAFRFTFTHFFAIILSVMFVVTAVLSLKLLTRDNCQCIGQTLYVAKTRNSSIQPQHNLAVLVPFRDRFEELLEFAPYMHDFLNAQNIAHDIFILNQVDSFRFNRASLINAGFLETKSTYDYVAMHDVDLLPLNHNLSYAYPVRPVHLAAPHLHPRYDYDKFIGGILLINREQFEAVDGLSNNYWGWGLEDDEFYVRLRDGGLNVTRPVGVTTGRKDTFRHIHGKHRKRDTTKCFNQREVTRRRDRVTGLHNVQYTVAGHKAMTIAGAPLTVINVKLHCNRQVTPWCDCSKHDDQKLQKANVTVKKE